ERDDVRLLTLTGPGGVGKTRLSLAIGEALRATFVDGVYVVPLAPLTDPALVLPAIAQTLEVKELGGQRLLTSLQAYLREKRLLLVLDNFEHVVAAGLHVAELLHSVPRLKLLVTSRMPLRVRGEREVAVAPLAVPGPAQHDLQDVTQYAAVQLFIARAQAAMADFAVTNATAPVVAEICARLDGLPLAIELAAARVKILSPEALLQRLGRRLQLLTGGARDLPARQQTLRSTMDWSYALLTAEEQALLQRVGVFVGVWTIEAAAALCAVTEDRELAILDGLQSLVDKSLVRQVGREGEQRFTMLETIREYALEQLAASGQRKAVQERYAAYYLALAEAAAPHLHGPEQATWLRRLEAEQDNLRAALSWSCTAEGGGHLSPAEVGLRLAAALWFFWHLRGSEGEGRRWIARVLERGADAHPVRARARALFAAGDLAWRAGEQGHATAYLEESLTLFDALGDRQGRTQALHTLGHVAREQGDFARATTLYEECLTVFEEVGDKVWAAWTLCDLGIVAERQGDYTQARLRFKKSLRRFREVGDTYAIGATLVFLADLEYDQGDYTQATERYEEALVVLPDVDAAGYNAVLARLWAMGGAPRDDVQALAHVQETLARQRQQGSRHGMAQSLVVLGEMAWTRADYAQARALQEEALSLAREAGCRGCTSRALYNLGRVALEQGDLGLARECLRESLALWRERGERQGMLTCLEG
ncbi:MAG: tetratricopeptide repeat protein, partial [Chloroflexi bacterium]|nr:tetratricopeptide repeat protein [Chloroflexota bacterium]